MSYYTLLTNIGLAKLMNAVALGQNVEWSEMAVGDGNGNPTTPTQTQTVLVRERHRAQINQLSVDPLNPNYLIAELVIPANVGGWTVHEVGVFDTDGDMVAVANFPATYKPVLAEGSGKDLVIRVIVEASNAAIVQLKIDPSVVLASRSWVVSNFLARSKVAGGTTNQVLRKKSNADEDFEWATPGVTNITVNVVQEVQTLATGQMQVDWATITTSGAAFYVGGARLEPTDYVTNSATRITLARAYPAGTKILGAQNEPHDNSKPYAVTSGGGVLTVSGGPYFIMDSGTYTLQSISALGNDAEIVCEFASGVTPTINVNGGASELFRAGIMAPYVEDTTLQHDRSVTLKFKLNKTANRWEIR